MSGDVHVRFCESPRGKLPRATRLILLHRDPDQLRRWRCEIEDFLMEKLGLELKQPVILQPISQGANFLGYIVRPDYLLVRQRVVGNLWEKLIWFEKQWIKGK